MVLNCKLVSLEARGRIARGGWWSYRAVGAMALATLACGEVSPSPAGSEATCGVPGQVIAAGLENVSSSPTPAPELEPLRGCRYFRGTLHLAPRDARALEALEALEEVDGSLVILAPPVDLGALSHLRRIGDKLILHAVYEPPTGLEALESAHDLWLYDGNFTHLEWLPKLTNVTGSIVARRNRDISAAALETFAAARAEPGASISLTDVLPRAAPDAQANAAPCGNAAVQSLLQDIPEGCTRVLGSLHLPDVTSGADLNRLSSLLEIDGSLTLFRNHTSDFGALRKLRRVGTKFQTHLLEGSLQGFESLREVGEFEVPNSGGLTNFEWLPALATVRESVVIHREEVLPADAVTSLVSRVEIRGEVLVLQL